MSNIVWDKVKLYYHRLGSPRYFYDISARFLPWFIAAAVLLLGSGLTLSLLFAPQDYQQGHSFRIMYIHVPAASLALSIYLMMAVSGAIGLIWKMKVADIVAKVCAPVGASFTFIALVTGAIWGKPTWGTWWIWDARLTSMLILLFLYLGVIALHSAMTDRQSAAKSTALLSLVGVVNLPIIKYSVNWWNTLHQPASFKLTEKPAMPEDMWVPLLVMMAGFYALLAVMIIMRTRCEIIDRERRSRWVKALVSGENTR
ncbi:MAG: heme ABC transporter permease [Gammaproteobacteria bacterium]|nr:heme ABC transporter permease [Gammaproteobacteria bacterium]